MAEIRVRPKRRSLAWLWILLTLVVLGLVAWYLVSNGYLGVSNSTPATAPTTAPAPTAAPAAPPRTGAVPAPVVHLLRWS